MLPQPAGPRQRERVQGPSRRDRFLRMKRLLLLGLLATGLPLLAQQPAAPLWKAGAAGAKITPRKMLWMAGYASRTKPAEGVEQDLFAKALVLEDAAGSRFALVTLDLIGVPRDLRLAVADRVAREHGIPQERLALNASHTHSGPELRFKRLEGVDDPERRQAEAKAYVEELETILVGLVGTALKAAAPARVEFCEARCGFAMNRRMPDGKGGWRNFPNPAGPVDHQVPVLKVTVAEGREVAIVFGYACHCTTLGHQKFSGDYAGYAQAAVEKAHPGAVALFVNGCSGDQNPYPRRSTEWAAIHGQTLATAVESALGTTPKPLAGRIRSAYREIPLAYGPLPTRTELEARQKGADKLDAAHAGRVLARLDAEGSLPQHYPYPVQVVRLGDDLTWVLLAGEVVIDYALRFKREIRDPLVWVSAYTNDVPTYIPSRRVWEEGGYEGGDAMKWGHHPAPKWNGEVESHIADTVHELRRGLE